MVAVAVAMTADEDEIGVRNSSREVEREQMRQTKDSKPIGPPPKRDESNRQSRMDEMR